MKQSKIAVFYCFSNFKKNLIFRNDIKLYKLKRAGNLRINTIINVKTTHQKTNVSIN